MEERERERVGVGRRGYVLQTNCRSWCLCREGMGGGGGGGGERIRKKLMLMW